MITVHGPFFFPAVMHGWKHVLGSKSLACRLLVNFMYGLSCMRANPVAAQQSFLILSSCLSGRSVGGMGRKF